MNKRNKLFTIELKRVIQFNSGYIIRDGLKKKINFLSFSE